MENNELEIIKQDIDWLTVIQLALDKKEWGRTYTLFKSKTTTITCTMVSFHFPKQKAIFELYCNYTHNNRTYDGNDWINYTTVEYHINNFTIDEFKRVLNRSVLSLMNRQIEYQTKLEGEKLYSFLKYDKYLVNYELLASQFNLDSDYKKAKLIQNDEIKSACIHIIEREIFSKLNEPYSAKVEEYVNSNSEIIDGFEVIIIELKDKLAKD